MLDLFRRPASRTQALLLGHRRTRQANHDIEFRLNTGFKKEWNDHGGLGAAFHSPSGQVGLPKLLNAGVKNGFQLLPGRLKAGRYDDFANRAGLTIAERWSTWDRDPWTQGDSYAVLVHIK